jgi:hypothetical protein
VCPTYRFFALRSFRRSVESLATTANTFDVTLAERCNGFRLTAREQLPFILPITYFCDLTSGEAMFAGLIN